MGYSDELLSPKAPEPAVPTKAPVTKETGPTTSGVMRSLTSGLRGETTPGEQAKAIDETVRSLASGASFGMADEFAAFMNSLVQGKPYQETLKAERERDQKIDPSRRIMGEMLGAGLTAGGMAKRGLTLMNPARPTTAGLAARGGLEGAAYGGAHGFGAGEGGLDPRLQSAAQGAALGGAGGAILGAAGGRLAKKTGEKTIPTTQTLKEASQKAYKAAESAGAVVQEGTFKTFVGNLQAKLTRKGADPTLHPKIAQAMKRLSETEGPMTFENIDILRRVARSASKSVEPDERRLGSIVIDALDDFMENLKPADVVKGNAKAAAKALKKARNLWSRYRKADEIEGLIERAGNRAGQFTGSGYENALRTEFRNLAQNPKRMRRFTKQEQAAIKKVVRGGPLQNVFRAIGRLAPRGAVSGGFHIGVGAATDPTVGFATMLAGEAARRAATRGSIGNVERLHQLLRTGGRKPLPQLPPEAISFLPPALAVIGQRGGLMD